MVTEAAAAIFLLGLALAAAVNLARGTLGEWMRAKFLNTEGPAPARVSARRPAPPRRRRPGQTGALPPQAGPRYSDPAPGAKFVSGWGAPRDGGRRSHKGIDLAAPRGHPVVAADSGTIVRVGSGGSLCGKRVAVRNRQGVEFLYCHLSGFAVVKGQSVRRGQTVAYIGSTGNASTTGPHLHFEIRVSGSPIDPRTLVGR